MNRLGVKTWGLMVIVGGLAMVNQVKAAPIDEADCRWCSGKCINMTPNMGVCADMEAVSGWECRFIYNKCQAVEIENNQSEEGGDQEQCLSEDMNCDGKVNLRDAIVWLKEYLVNLGSDSYTGKADFNDDQVLNREDWVSWKKKWLWGVKIYWRRVFNFPEIN